ncbi:MAG: polysaccharide biosynthesis tyrosine autokinase [bacterium]
MNKRALRVTSEKDATVRDKIIKEKMSDTVTEPPPQYEQTKRTRTVEIPKEILKENRLIALFDESPLSNRYKVLKTQILQRVKLEGLNTLLITSATEREGKSLTAANLAISLAKELPHTVLLVDADLRTPSLGPLFGLYGTQQGLSDYFLAGIPLADLLVSPGIDKLTLLPGHESLDNSAEVISSPKMKQLVDEVKHRYSDRFIIFDSAPLLGYADSLILSQYVDGVILVVEYGKTPCNQVEKSLHLLQGINLLGTVLNKAPD